MNFFKCLFILASIFLSVSIYGQENAVPMRTPEQEALKQTEKLQRELNLNQEQTKMIYEINLRYAKERQNSNTRSEAMERIKKKNNDLQKILTGEQYDKLQNKRYERSNINIPQPTGKQEDTEYPYPASSQENKIKNNLPPESESKRGSTDAQKALPETKKENYSSRQRAPNGQVQVPQRRNTSSRRIYIVPGNGSGGSQYEQRRNESPNRNSTSVRPKGNSDATSGDSPAPGENNNGQ